MTGLSGEQDRLSCSDAKLLLEKTIAEEALSVEERQTIEHHLDRCPRCRNLIRLTSGLPVFAKASADGEFDTAIDAVMKSLNDRRRAERARRTRWAAMAIAGAVAVLTLVGMPSLQNDPQSPTAVSPSFRCNALFPAEPVPGVFLTHCGKNAPETIIENNTVKVSLRKGAVGLFVDPARPGGQKVVVETRFGEVRVKGTLFTVGVDRSGAWVEVLRGVVEVVPETEKDLAFKNPAFKVAAGYGASLKQRGEKYKLSEPAAAPLFHELQIHAVDKTSGQASADNEDSRESSPSPAPQDAGEETDDEAAAQIEEEIRREADDGSPKRLAASMDVLIQDAQSCLLARDWKCAASRYREVLKAYSRRPESSAVLISLAKIELRRLDMPKKALARYKAYLRQAPTGPLAEEALLGAADAYRRLGLEEQEEETLRRFVEKFPKSSLSGKARTRLKQLSDTPPL
jgi:TolA-binding protein